MPDSHVADVCIGIRQDGELIWKPVKVQMAIDRMTEFEWQQKSMAAFPAALLAKPFQWSAESFIVLDIKLGGHRTRAVFDPGCSGVEILQAWADRQKITLDSRVPLTIASAEGVTSISRGVLNSTMIDWKDSKVSLLAIILPGAGFDVLLGMAWISCAKVGLNTKRKVLMMNGNENKYDQLCIPAPPSSSALVVIYASEISHIPAWGKVEVAIQSFDQGGYGGM